MDKIEITEYEAPAIEETSAVEALMTWWCKDPKGGGGHHS